MTAKEYLNRFRSLELRLISNANEIENLTDIATSITSAINSDGIHVTGATSDKLSNCVSRIIDLQREIDSEIEALEEMRSEVVEQIDSLPNQRHRDILRLRYVSLMTFEQIAIEMDMSWRHTIRLHGHALRDFSEKFSSILAKKT